AANPVADGINAPTPCGAWICAWMTKHWMTMATRASSAGIRSKDGRKIAVARRARRRLARCEFPFRVLMAGLTCLEAPNRSSLSDHGGTGNYTLLHPPSSSFQEGQPYRVARTCR